MSGTGIAVDIGTSGFRAQALDMPAGDIVSTVITTGHPLPGGNVIDHLLFAMEVGSDVVSGIMIEGIKRVIAALGVPPESVSRMAVCGNPAQLSLFQGMEIRDLAYSGRRKLESLGVSPPKRDAAVLKADSFPGLGLTDRCDVIIPPAVRHEIGADTLAMILKSGMLDRKETSIAIDYGTNAEMALFHEGHIYTGSTAAGPSLEGQEITCGTLAVPGAISDLEPEGPYHRQILLDEGLLPVKSSLINLREAGHTGDEHRKKPIGVTGTGTIAAIEQGIRSGIITAPRINTPDRQLHLDEDIYLTEGDLAEAGKAIGSIRAGYTTLCHRAGIKLTDVRTVYMSGAAGTYVDARKAANVGLMPPGSQTIYQVGNTSLALARDLATGTQTLESVSGLAGRLRKTHCMFATSGVFKKIFMLELSHWTEGMPMHMYRSFLQKYGYPDLPPPDDSPRIVHKVSRDIVDTGRLGLKTLTSIGNLAGTSFAGCTACLQCMEMCPEKAISVDTGAEGTPIILDTSLCKGVSCKRCERACIEQVFELRQFFGRPGRLSRQDIANHTTSEIP